MDACDNTTVFFAVASPVVAESYDFPIDNEEVIEDMHKSHQIDYTQTQQRPLLLTWINFHPMKLLILSQNSTVQLPMLGKGFSNFTHILLDRVHNCWETLWCNNDLHSHNINSLT